MFAIIAAYKEAKAACMSLARQDGQWVLYQDETLFAGTSVQAAHSTVGFFNSVSQVRQYCQRAQYAY